MGDRLTAETTDFKFAVADASTKGGRDFGDKYGVGEEGYPNVKAFAQADTTRPTGFVARGALSYDELASKVADLRSSLTLRDAEGFYLKQGLVKDEL
eukprot:NODE_2604_length_766_cov_405.131102_g1824_i0.p3 GENE.NODE_2604_length_766_cov_405.131102_g1824_i0~~NODE_2604_length_766_cov_405.131102_g1824_i0.p3  ORF type:complete len:105 (-),score=42.66 NODE_2604_length_766_cov_405.131102_g1824_i0:450-740(-)